MLASRSWEDAATFARYSQQNANLGLKPWETPPCWLTTASDLKAALAAPHDYIGRR